MTKAIIFSILGLLFSSQQYAYSTQNEIQEDIVGRAQALQAASLREQLLQQGVIVRVWSGALHGGQNVGHVSLETAQDYISFWPDDEHNSGHFMRNLNEDLDAEEGRDPEVTVFLKHPQESSVNSLHEDFNFLKWLLLEGRLKWSLHGEVQDLKHKNYFSEDNWMNALEMPAGLIAFSTPPENMYWSFNCASLVLNLLINNAYLEERHQHSSMLCAFNTAVTPDRVATICSEKFLEILYEEHDLSRIYQILDRRIKEKGGDRFLSHHVQYFGRHHLKSIGDQIIENPRLDDEVIEIIRRDEQEGVGRSLMRAMDFIGAVDMFANILGRNNVESLANSARSKHK